MIYRTNGEIKSIDFGASGKAAKLQCIDYALATFKGTCFLDRTFGWEPPIDEPLTPQTEAMVAEGLTQLITDNIEDVAINSIETSYDENYHMHPLLEVELLDG